MATKSRASSLLFTAVALIAVLLCIRLGFWQFDRYQIRHELTDRITLALKKDAKELNSKNQGDVSPWMKVRITGTYNQESQTISRGHYFQNQYGLEVLSLFIPKDSLIPPIWVDRGWIATSKGADITPTIPTPPEGTLDIEGVLRNYDDPTEAQGVFFALPAPRIGRIDEITLQKTFPGETFHYYLKINNAVNQQLDITPLTPPGDGPHLAYAIQWWIFALLIAGTRIALFKSEKQ